MSKELDKLDNLMREIEMDEYLNEETLPKIREAIAIINGLCSKTNKYKKPNNPTPPPPPMDRLIKEGSHPPKPKTNKR